MRGRRRILPSMGNQRGMGLPSTMLGLTMLASLGFALSGLSVQHLKATQYQENRQQALQLARSAAALALARLAEDPLYGKTPTTEVLTVEGDRPDASGMVTFDRGRAPFSSNNLEEPNATQGWEGRRVASNTVLLVAVGRCGGVEKRLEAVVAVPPFPYALAAAGPIDARRGVIVASVAGAVNEPVTEDSEVRPGHLLSNDPSGEAVFLGAGTNITGDARAVGQVKLDAAAPQGTIRVQGRVASGSARRAMPELDLKDYDPQQTGQGFTRLESDTLASGAPLSGSFRRVGDLHVTQGLKLDGGLLYVQGNLTVAQGVSGKGTVLATGRISVDGQSEFRSGNGVALLSGDDLRLTGSGPLGSYYQGLLYSNGGLEADKVTVVGSLVAAGPRQVVLEEARIFQPQGAPTPAPAPSPDPPGYNDVTYDLLGALINVRFDNRGGTMYANVDWSWNGGWASAYPIGPNPAGFLGWLEQSLNDRATGYGETWHAGRISEFVSRVRTEVMPGGGNNAAPLPLGLTTFDPSHFMSLGERIQVVQWREQ